MFDIGWQELIVLGAVALVVFPPKEFPNLLKTIISVINKVRATTQEVQHHIHNFSKTHLEDISRETSKTRNLIHDSSHRIQRQIKDLENRAKLATRNPNPKKSSKKSSQKSPKESLAKTTAPKAKTTAPKISKTLTPKTKTTAPKISLAKPKTAQPKTAKAQNPSTKSTSTKTPSTKTPSTKTPSTKSSSGKISPTMLPKVSSKVSPHTT